ncbi:MAG: peptide ABC transporter permease [Acidobacteria bacterium RBG_16_64_8]|nr:MAG: peptide ABC transporter permease [Acidobacteria bacterium RBG_16_64_8]
MLVISAVLLTAVGAPLLSPHVPTRGDLDRSLLPPFWASGGSLDHPLGTDLYGRDQLSRIFYGARISLWVAALVISVSIVVGTPVGMIAGYVGGWFDAILMRMVDLVLAFPLILLAIMLAVVFGPSFANVVVVVSLLIWPRLARLIRAETLSLRHNDFVVYAEVVGIPVWRIMIRHLFPNVLPTLIVMTTLEIGHVILIESSLSFLGAGIPPPYPSWGLMVADGRGRIVTGWWLSLFPGLAILVTVLAFTLFGDWLRERLDPRLRDR